MDTESTINQVGRFPGYLGSHCTLLAWRVYPRAEEDEEGLATVAVP